MRNGRSLITHINRLKPYHVPLDGSHEFKDHTAVVQPSPTDKHQPQIQSDIYDDQIALPIIDPQPRPIPLPPIPVVRAPIVADDGPINVDPSFSAPKHGRGRPRKVQTRLLRFSCRWSRPLCCHRPPLKASHCILASHCPPHRGEGM